MIRHLLELLFAQESRSREALSHPSAVSFNPWPVTAMASQQLSTGRKHFFGLGSSSYRVVSTAITGRALLKSSLTQGPQVHNAPSTSVTGCTRALEVLCVEAKRSIFIEFGH